MNRMTHREMTMTERNIQSIAGFAQVARSERISVNGANYLVNATGDNLYVHRKISRQGVTHWRTVRPGTGEHRSVWLAWKRRP